MSAVADHTAPRSAEQQAAITEARRARKAASRARKAAVVQTHDRLCRRFRMLIAYDGRNFHGWQKQNPPGQEPLRTVCKVVEDCVRPVLPGAQRARFFPSGRTDAGVSAAGQARSARAARCCRG